MNMTTTDCGWTADWPDHWVLAGVRLMRALDEDRIEALEAENRWMRDELTSMGCMLVCDGCGEEFQADQHHTCRS